MMTNQKYCETCCRTRFFVGFCSILLCQLGCTNLKSATEFIQDKDSGNNEPPGEYPSSRDSDLDNPYKSSGKTTLYGEDSDAGKDIPSISDGSVEGIKTETDTVADRNANNPTCSDKGALRCTSVGSSAREICRGGIWVNAAPCSADEICDTSNMDQSGSCVDASIACKGSANQLICFKGVMHECNPDAISVSQQMCKSQRHCQIGLSNGQCAECIAAEEYRCEGAKLEVCADDGTGFELFEECDSPDMCHAATRSCTGDASCMPEVYMCEQNMLRGCNDDQTGFEDLQQCEAGLCDVVHGECDICVPGENICRDGGRVTCSDDGQKFEVTECKPPRSMCTGSGVCVECLTIDDCHTEEPCRKPDCSLNQCTTVIDVGVSCGADNRSVCNELGDCVECLNNSHCAAPTPFCNTERNECTECLDSGDCDETQECTDGICLYTSRCGNGIVETGEHCDDGNVRDQDGCPSNCRATLCTPSWYCLNVSEYYCTCNENEWCTHNQQEGERSKYVCAFACETDYDCPDVGWPLKCVFQACVVPCDVRNNDKDCPEDFFCSKGYTEGKGPYENCTI